MTRRAGRHEVSLDVSLIKVAAAENLQEIYRKNRTGLQAFLSRTGKLNDESTAQMRGFELYSSSLVASAAIVSERRGRIMPTTGAALRAFHYERSDTVSSCKSVTKVLLSGLRCALLERGEPG
jgi:hypothetical protein